VVGILLTKDLIFVDPEDETPVKSFVDMFGRNVQTAWYDTKLSEILKIFKAGKAHLAIVNDVNNEGDGDPFYEVKGIITLEDIIEEIIGDEIIDETDVYIDIDKHKKVERRSFDYARLRLLDHRIVDDKLSREEVSALCAHLRENYPDVFKKGKDGKSEVDPQLLKDVLNSCPVMEMGRVDEEGVGHQQMNDKHNYIYKANKPETTCTVILGGKCVVTAGREKFHSEAGPWSVLGADALILPVGDYTPDFTAYVDSDKVRCLRISHTHFQRIYDPDFKEIDEKETQRVDRIRLRRGTSTTKLTDERRGSSATNVKTDTTMTDLKNETTEVERSSSHTGTFQHMEIEFSEAKSKARVQL